jgi:hypothetical protein
MSGCRLLLIFLASLTGLVQQSSAAGAESAGKTVQEYLIVGTVVWANAASASIAIRGTSLIGRLHIDVKSYHVKQPSALTDLHPGDRITAVFSEKDRMLHRLRRIVERGPY